MGQYIDIAKAALQGGSGTPLYNETPVGQERDSMIVVHGSITIQPWPDGRLSITDLLPYVPLIMAECSVCRRRYYWRVVPKQCSWPNCDGVLREAKS